MKDSSAWKKGLKSVNSLLYQVTRVNPGQSIRWVIDGSMIEFGQCLRIHIAILSMKTTNNVCVATNIRTEVLSQVCFIFYYNPWYEANLEISKCILILVNKTFQDAEILEFWFSSKKFLFLFIEENYTLGSENYKRDKNIGALRMKKNERNENIVS